MNIFVRFLNTCGLIYLFRLPSPGCPSGVLLVALLLASQFSQPTFAQLTSQQAAKLLVRDGAVQDYSSLSVAINGNTAILGLDHVDVGRRQDQGAAYVYTLTDGVWTQTQKLFASDGAADAYFGSSVAIAGDIAIVGSLGADIAGKVNQGAVYVFTRNGNSWSQTARLTASDRGSQFGVSVDLDGDTFVVGSYANTAYVFTSDGSVWTQTQAGQRVFNVNIEGGATELVDLDVLAAAGGANRALSRSFPIDVRDGNLSIVFSSKVSKAMISAIQITPAASSRVSSEVLAGRSREDNAWQAYPNPFTDQLTLPVGESSGKVVVRIGDGLGRSVYQQLHQPQGGEVALSLAYLKAGVYLISVQPETGIGQTLRVVKQ